MNSRERVLMALNHKEPDRVPFDLGGTNVTGISKAAYKRLLDYIGIQREEKEIKTFCVIQQLGQIDDDVANRLKTDVRVVTPRTSSAWNLNILEDGPYYKFVDEWGITWKMPKDGGFYFDMVDRPLADAVTVEDIERYKWPDTADSKRFDGLEEELKEVYDRTGCAIVMQGVSAGFFELSGWLRGMENFFADLICEPELACKIMDKALEVKMHYWDKVLSLGKDYIHVVHEAEDLATQNSLLISPGLYRKYIKPRQKELYSFIKSKAPVKVFFHSCGAVKELIPDLIEVGVDILNPVQVSAAGMGSKELKKEFGNDIVFWGGGVDTQRILPLGTVEEVKEEVKRRIEDLMPGGGFIFNTVHNIQADVPPENIMAMWEALQEYGIYKK